MSNTTFVSFAYFHIKSRMSILSNDSFNCENSPLFLQPVLVLTIWRLKTRVSASPSPQQFQPKERTATNSSPLLTAQSPGSHPNSAPATNLCTCCNQQEAQSRLSVATVLACLLFKDTLRLNSLCGNHVGRQSWCFSTFLGYMPFVHHCFGQLSKEFNTFHNNMKSLFEINF